jgi:DNA-binding transcriptional MerR regulator
MQKEYYTINDLERFSGIKAHTIRIWEKRYNLLVPKRTDTNIRYYTNSDLKKILNISILNKNGIKISKIADFKESEIIEKVIEFTTRRNEVEDHLQSLIIAMLNFDLNKFEKLIAVSYINRGFENTYSNVISPFMDKVDVLWQTGMVSAVQKCFALNIIKRKIITSTDSVLPIYKENVKNFTLFLPENEYNEIPLLYAHYLLKYNNQNVTYLGASVPYICFKNSDIVDKTDYFVISITDALSLKEIKSYLNSISKHFKDIKIIVFGTQIDRYEYTLPPNVFKITDVNSLITDF